MVHPLSQQLDGWLGTVGLQGWHVHIINKEDEITSEGWTKHPFPPEMIDMYELPVKYTV